MQDRDEVSIEAPVELPAIVVVDADQRARTEIESALNRRFGRDYRVLSVGSAATGMSLLEQCALWGDEVALVAADLHLPDMDGVDFLERARDLHPGAGCALLVAMDSRGTRIPHEHATLAAIQRATALGRIDFAVLKGWVSPEEWLYPQVQEALSRWTRAHGPRHEVMRVVGEQWAPRSHELRDMLSRNTIPFGFYPMDSPT